MSQSFVERRFERDGVASVLLQVSQPVKDGEDYRCEIKIVWPDRNDVKIVMGVDPVQALLLALQCAHVWMLASPEGRSGGLTWFGEKHLGLPLPDSVAREDFA